MADKQYLRVKSGFVLADRTIVKAGQIVTADDRVVKGREELFEPMEDHVEAATRAPGERRLSLRRPDAVVLSAARPTRRRSRKTPEPAAETDAATAAAADVVDDPAPEADEPGQE
ncbi:hypothetical protein SAMN05421805_104194 [Saccharopolyspora antimicrobica]|uniref:Uncharacterized protein n=1 Tax=Saccharopolyspora antimicrobica TaxID=455193 RepID=A0A1I4YLV3_9PSEU|nr:hypothetical protein [Saccharopolyspora antimicrobica]RKT82723.1 hypothetical protein ATL45_0978 [Saccharopolyspora antimicrobica]SFN38763.1 hypothetical protein SAMN05421805_104194 [Saccharopolyspora antimicrobica]